jgi:hypothetical protein
MPDVILLPEGGSHVEENETRIEALENAGVAGLPDLVARQGRTRLCLFADFSDYDDGALSGTSLEIGDNPWLTTGGQLPAVTDGKVSSTGSGYLYTSLDSGSFLLVGGDFSFGGTHGSVPCTIALCRNESDLLDHFAHLIVSPTEFTLTIRKDGGGFEDCLGTSWSSRLKIDGTVYRFALMIDGETVSVFGPNGDAFATAEPRIAEALSGSPPTAFWQASTAGATLGYLHRSFGFSYEDTHYPNFSDFTSSAISGGINTREGSRPGFSAGYGQPGNVYVGPSGSAFPSVRLGARFILGELRDDMDITDTTFQSDRVIPAGCTVVIGMGDDEESFTTTGYPGEGTAPFTITVTVAATKAHASESGFVATGMTTKEIYQSLGDGSLNMPDFVVQSSTNYFFGGDYTCKFERPAANVFGLGSGDVFRQANGATGSRPSAADVGAGSVYFDTTIGKPIWSTGSAWVLSDGTAA